MARIKSMKKKQKIENTIIYILLVLLSIIWIIPIIAILYVSLNPDSSQAAVSIRMFYPISKMTFSHYVELFTYKLSPKTDVMPSYVRWYLNTLGLALCVMLINTFFILSLAYTMSRLKFKGRKTLMSINLVLGMFPGFMSMIAIYNILKLFNTLLGLGDTLGLVHLGLCYSMASGSGFYIAKGFFDTVPKSLDEAARIDGANNAAVFFKIVLPLSKPIIVYTLVTAFMGPWMDYIFCSYVIRNNTDNFTVALGLYQWLNTQELKNTRYTDFFAGSVLVSIPIMAVFLATQKYYVEGVTGGAVKG